MKHLSHQSCIAVNEGSSIFMGWMSLAQECGMRELKKNGLKISAIQSTGETPTTSCNHHQEGLRDQFFNFAQHIGRGTVHKARLESSQANLHG